VAEHGQCQTDSELSTSVDVPSSLKCAASRSDGKIQNGNGKSQVKNRKYEDDYIKFRFGNGKSQVKNRK
jgi:hypothetical protein